MPESPEAGVALARHTCRARDSPWNENGVTPLGWRYKQARFVAGAAQFVLPGIAIVLALIGHHWFFVPLWLLTVMPPPRGYIIVSHLVGVGAAAVCIAVGLWPLAVLGIVAPLAVHWGYTLTIGGYFGDPRKMPLWRFEYPTRPWEEREVERFQRLLARWQRRIAAAPTDAAELERVLFQMRDFWMTPRQAVEFACRAGAPRELAEQIVETVIRWPHLDSRNRVEAIERWDIAIGT